MGLFKLGCDEWKKINGKRPQRWQDFRRQIQDREDGEKTDAMSKRTLKNLYNKNVCKSEAGCISEQTQ